MSEHATTCKTCAFYDAAESLSKQMGRPAGKCLKIEDWNHLDKSKPALAYTADYEGWNSYFYVAEDFGCVLHEVRDE